MSIKTNAEQIRDETTTGANTAARVGGNLVEIADDLLAKQTAIDLNTAKNSYPDEDAAKLAGIEDNAEVNPTDAEIKTQLLNNTDTNIITDAQLAQLVADGLIKKIRGIIYWDGTDWLALDNTDHESIGITSVTHSNGTISVHYNGFDKVVAGFVSHGGLSLFGLMATDLGMGRTYTSIDFYVPRPTTKMMFVSFASGAWTASNYGGTLSGNPTVTNVGDSNSKLTLNYGDSVEYPLFNIKVGGPNYQSFRVHEWSSGFSNTNAILKLKDWSGADYTPTNGDWFIVAIDHSLVTPSYATNRYGPQMNRVSNWSWLPASVSGSFNNFQFELYGTVTP